MDRYRLLIVMSVWGGAFLGCGANDSGRQPPAEAERNAAPPSRIEPPPVLFRGELFDKAHRAALEFDPSEGGTRPLFIELDLIESAIRSDEERAVFDLLTVVGEIQFGIVVLNATRLATKEMLDAFDAMTPGGKNLLRTTGPQIYHETVAIGDIYRAGGVPVESMVMSKAARAIQVGLVQKQSLTPEYVESESHLRIGWIPYDSTMSQLQARVGEALTNVGRMIHNEGQSL